MQKYSEFSFPESVIKILVFCFFISGCANNDDYQTIYDAQRCLDKATVSTAQNCINMVSGKTGAAASLIRCAGVFIIENKFTTSGLQTIINGFKNGGTSNTNVMSALVFSSSSNATTAATECSASGSGGLALLASMAGIATKAASLGGCSNPPSQSCIQTNASTIASTPGVSTAVSTAYTQNCSSSGASGTYQSFCSQYSSALTASPSDPITYFLSHMN